MKAATKRRLPSESEEDPQNGIASFVALSFLTLALNYGVRNTFGLFLKPLASEFETSRGAISSILSVTMATYGGMAFLTGFLNDRFGSKIVLALGASIAAVSMLLTGLSTSPFQVMLCFGIMFGGATCFLSQITALSLLMKLPFKVTSLSLGVVGSAPAVGSLILTLLVGKIIVMAGWRPAMEIIACLFLAYLILNLMILRKSANGRGHSKSTKKIGSLAAIGEWRNLAFLFFSFFFMCVGIYGVLSQEAAYATDQGISVAKAALALGLISGTGVVASPLIGWLSDRLRKKKMLGVYSLWLAVGGVSLIYVSSYWLMLALGSIFIGTAYASYVPIFTSITGALVSPQLFGRIWGLISMGGSLGCASGSWLGGSIYDLTSNYDLLWFIVGGCFLFASLLLMLVNTGAQEHLSIRKEKRPA